MAFQSEADNAAKLISLVYPIAMFVGTFTFWAFGKMLTDMAINIEEIKAAQSSANDGGSENVSN